MARGRAGPGPRRPERVISGGQTGVDRAALDAALEAGIAVGGFCPRGRRAEDGVIPSRYPLEETRSARYAERTRRNVEAADATLILSARPLTGGTRLTAEIAKALGKPLCIVDPHAPDAERQVRAFLDAVHPRVLNVAGPRASGDPGIYEAARRLLLSVFGRLR